MSEPTPTDRSPSMNQHVSHLQPDGTTFPPVTPDPPPPPGYVDPLPELEAERSADGERTAYEGTGDGDAEGWA